jgi:lipopolysaccharide biosynthesis glycosyltransferase
MNVKSILKLYPDAMIAITDIGFTEEEAKKLMELGEMVSVVKENIDRNENLPMMAMALKPLVLLSYANTGCDLIWFDGDVVLLRNIDELFEMNADVVVTVREIKRENARINTGVIVLMTNIHYLLVSWLKQTIQENLNNKSRWAEQDAFNKVIYSNIFRFKEVECATYNYTEIEKGISDDVKIVHVKNENRLKSKKLIDSVRKIVDAE